MIFLLSRRFVVKPYYALLSLFILLLAAPAYAQKSAAGGPKVATADSAAIPAPKRQFQATRITEPIKVDGELDEAVWRAAPVATNFIETRPTPGRPEKHATEVRLLYDDAALYIGAVMHDVSPDSIFRELTQRDDLGNTDYFAVFLDTYNDKLNGYGFFLTPGGVELDARYSPAGGEDFNWNAVWMSQTKLRGNDWIAEIRIPYSAIRFSDAAEQVWGINFARQRQSTRQQFFWNQVKPQVDGFVNQWGELRGVRDIKPPLRLSLTPYVSSYYEHFPFNEQGKRNSSTSFNGGADVKWGINESFTLDATLVPDFGQVQSDNQVLNLSPFEVQYNENRQFFTEGTELFNKGGLFYSRRVGGQPLGFYEVDGKLRGRTTSPEGQIKQGEYVVSNPGVTRLLNATKISGRTKGGLGVGLFNALSNDVYATVQDSTSGERREVLTQPFSNYNIFVLDQSLKNNSYVSLINTNVTRKGSTYDANVTGGLFRFADKSNRYALKGQANYSRRRGTEFGSEKQIDNQDGYKYQLELAKISGNWNWSVNHGIESETYDPNDLGILFSNNSISQEASVSYSKYEPFWKVNQLRTNLGIYQTLLYKPTRFQNLGFYASANTTFTKNFSSTGLNVNGNLEEQDFFEPRRRPLGTYYVRVPANLGISGYGSSDYRKKFAYDISLATRLFQADGQRTDRINYGLGISPRYRVSNRLSFRYNFDWQLQQNQIGYAGGLSSRQEADRPFIRNGVADVLLGRRNRTTTTNTVSANYTFTNRMSFTIRTRHYLSVARYRDFSRLNPGGEEEAVDYRRNRDNSFNAFNVDAVFSWWFAPGSQITVVWKNANASELAGDQTLPQYFTNFNNTLNTPHNNSVSVKILYFLDYLTLRPKRG
ncbi:DUF5916 domain-containing protein [Hymenobacter lapidiphilus]|uniref:Carbohydrate binding family 9 domain-containing protein n=1 Tax=Hymenobacter lapidiphilus TaxID=2608003 RepID=A0A7Y7U408_9BACT|nr:DUF5916 domain-containing protein [Hymenobacter lapidiphilus]NVO29938.1 carbohydrate binding family 9 domain-containing protein [Hymenobacter lapidiphilus]